MAKPAREPRITWQIEEYSHRDKSPDWYWALGVIAIAGAAIAVIYHNVLFAVFIILSAVVLGYYAFRHPKVIDIAISDDGLRIRNYFYDFKNIKGFAVEESELENHLLIESDRILMPVIVIALPATLDADGLAVLLRTKIEEKPLKAFYAHKVMERLGF